MSGSLNRELVDVLEARAAMHLRRVLSLPGGIDFASNDYLGLSRHAEVIAAAGAALHRFGAGTPSSRLLRGHHCIHESAEAAMAQWTGGQRALLLPSGWHANLAALTVLSGADDRLLSDRLNHASLIDGSRLSAAGVTIFDHCAPTSLERALAAAAGARRRIIVTESVFSMDGDRAPLATYLELAERHDAYLIVDEAHAIGLLGEQGAGLAREFAAHPRLLARIITGGKALGVSGAFVVGSAAVVDSLINFGRSFIYTTAVTPPTAAALTAAIGIARSQSAARRRVLSIAQRLRRGLRRHGAQTPGDSPIVPLLLGDARRSLTLAQHAMRAGFDVRAIRPPTVPVGASRLRLVCHADHSDDQVDQLAKVLGEGLRRNTGPTETSEQPNPSERSTGSISSAVAKGGHEPTPRAIAVVGTDTGVGKTVVSALLLRAFMRAGRRVAYLKPVQTGPDCDTQTVRALARLAAAESSEPVLRFDRPASVDQAAAAAGASVRVEDVESGVRQKLEQGPQRQWIVETAGGLLVPYNGQEDQSLLLQRLNLATVLVARAGLGTLNHTALTLEAMAKRGLQPAAVILVGAPHDENRGTLAERLGPTLPLFCLPALSDLDHAALDRWLDQTPHQALLDAGVFTADGAAAEIGIAN